MDGSILQTHPPVPSSIVIASVAIRFRLVAASSLLEELFTTATGL
jgi:hypothetical protein